MTVASKNGLRYRNCVMTHITHSDGVYRYPNDFVMAKRKFIVVRECFATLLNPHTVKSFAVGDICLHASFVWETSNHYCCLVNSQNTKKKKFEVLNSTPDFTIEFKTIDGARIQPESYLFDFLLVMEID